MTTKPMCKSCGEKLAKYKGGLCARCFRAEHGISGNQAKGVIGTSGQLKAIRKALRWTRPDPPKSPLVRMYLKLMETNPREVAQQLERLEKEHRLSLKPAAGSKAAPVSEKKPERSASDEDYERGDGYDLRTDTTTPAVLGMIDRWLAGCKARAEAGLGLPESASPVVDDSDDLDIPG